MGAANGERLAFSIISNNVPSTWRAKRVEDAIGARLAAFSRPAAPSLAAAPPADADAAGPADAPAPTAPPRPVVQSAAESEEARSHVIRQGDTLEAIARRYQTTVAELERANPGVDPRRLIPGRALVIP